MLLNLEFILKRVAPIEKLAHISSNVVIVAKFTTWVLIHEPGEINYQIIKNNKFLTVDDSLFEFISRNGIILNSIFNLWKKECIFVVQTSLIYDLNYHKDQNGEEYDHPFERKIIVMLRIGSIVMDSKPDRK